MFYLLLPKPKTSRFKYAARMRKKWTVLDDSKPMTQHEMASNFTNAIFMKNDLFFKEVPRNGIVSGQIITTSAEVTLNGGLVREYPKIPLIQVKDL